MGVVELGAVWRLAVHDAAEAGGGLVELPVDVAGAEADEDVGVGGLEGRQAGDQPADGDGDVDLDVELAGGAGAGDEGRCPGRLRSKASRRKG